MDVEVAVNGPCCSGCGACVELAPEVFALDTGGTAQVICSRCPQEVACKAAQYCPEDCIEVMVPGTSAEPACHEAGRAR
ncbi:MAG: hypothetical protein JG774_291 [Desulfomicrobiaceae bacterium]|jgi:ferredoxin|nr:ferredoxin [Desulfomicrobiaceae bacterium]MBZ4684546.1 hypothetical protein [Desulfomicrobiaceae bacterium]MDI3493183.1 ferredoxin [Desulfomicrobiaceae bacterium]MDK2872766.1 ferredoxin [Desulfomicrobiaceae bacterium]